MEFSVSGLLGSGLLSTGLLNPLFYPFDPSRRVFIGFILIAMLMAYFVYPVTVGKRSLMGFVRYFFQKNIWLHVSSKLDMKMVFVNSMIVVTFIAPLIVAKLAVVVAVSSGVREQFGPVSNELLPYWLIMCLFTFIIFVAEDLNRFILHLCYHRIPMLWEFHKVHHSAEVLTPLTLYRTHPVEILISQSSSIVVIGAITGLFVYLFPGQLSALEILGVDLLGFIFNALGANLRHSNIRFSFGRGNYWFISPVMHQVHHSDLKPHHNKNFGSCFSIWDRVIGSLYIPGYQERMVFGCRDAGSQTLFSQYLSPFYRLYNVFNQLSRSSK